MRVAGGIDAALRARADGTELGRAAMQAQRPGHFCTPWSSTRAALPPLPSHHFLRNAGYAVAVMGACAAVHCVIAVDHEPVPAQAAPELFGGVVRLHRG